MNDLDAYEIGKKVPYPAILENLAEECCELAHSCLKRARIYREDNPTPADPGELDMNIAEELGDVLNVAQVLGVTPRMSLRTYKMKRWLKRLHEAEERMER